jgi:hypothetical protein
VTTTTTCHASDKSLVRERARVHVRVTTTNSSDRPSRNTRRTLVQLREPHSIRTEEGSEIRFVLWARELQIPFAMQRRRNFHNIRSRRKKKKNQEHLNYEGLRSTDTYLQINSGLRVFGSRVPYVGYRPRLSRKTRTIFLHWPFTVCLVLETWTVRAYMSFVYEV